MANLHFAAFGPETLALLIPITALLIPIVAILVRHQQKMAEIIHSSPKFDPGLNAQIDSLRREILELRQLVHQQTIDMDSLKSLTGGRNDVVRSEETRAPNG
ncbi:MAG: hypothetical protein IT202_02655 [Fimbriimonadaceae bacterium]|nr:hypothetical protein [Fimbriimonadaceae bacterium]MCC6351390.1 hypothetical protein [Fimbriimonadaceae bacterium]